MKQDELLFHKFWPGVLCLFLFWLADVWGFIKLVFWHGPIFHIGRKRWFYGWLVFFNGKNRKMIRKLRCRVVKSAAFCYRYPKAKDCLANVSVFDGRSDETISNHAGKLWLEHQFQSPVWVIYIKWLTDRLDPPKNGKSHIEDSIEPIRPDYWTEK